MSTNDTPSVPRMPGVMHIDSSPNELPFQAADVIPAQIAAPFAAAGATNEDAVLRAWRLLIGAGGLINNIVLNSLRTDLDEVSKINLLQMAKRLGATAVGPNRV